jgi:thioredoxin 1
MKVIRLLSFVLLFSAAFGWAQSAQREIYPDPTHAKADILVALKAAPQAHKRVLIVFGANPCSVCQVLDRYMQETANRSLLDAGYLLVHVNVGNGEYNLDLGAKYKFDMSNGIPAAAILSEKGELLYSKAFASAPHESFASPVLTALLTQWKP